MYFYFSITLTRLTRCKARPILSTKKEHKHDSLLKSFMSFPSFLIFLNNIIFVWYLEHIIMQLSENKTFLTHQKNACLQYYYVIDQNFPC